MHPAFTCHRQAEPKMITLFMRGLYSSCVGSSRHIRVPMVLRPTCTANAGTMRQNGGAINNTPTAPRATMSCGRRLPPLVGPAVVFFFTCPRGIRQRRASRPLPKPIRKTAPDPQDLILQAWLTTRNVIVSSGRCTPSKTVRRRRGEGISRTGRVGSAVRTASRRCRVRCADRPGRPAVFRIPGPQSTPYPPGPQSGPYPTATDGLKPAQTDSNPVSTGAREATGRTDRECRRGNGSL
jgi:hypothetical protein